MLYTTADEVSEIKKHPLAGCKAHGNVVPYETIFGTGLCVGGYLSCIDESEGVNHIVGKPVLRIS